MNHLSLASAFVSGAISLCTPSLSIAQTYSTQACISAPGLAQQLCDVNSTEPTEFAGTQFGNDGIPLGSGAAAALASFGTLRARTTATELLFAAEGASSIANSNALALFGDSLTISNPALNGERGYVDFRIDYSWVFSNNEFSSNGQFNTADVTLEFGAGAAYARTQHAQGALPGTVESILIPIGVIGDNVTALDALLGSFYTVRMPFVFGVEYSLRQSLSLGSQASFGATSSIDAFNSAYWGGMIVRDETLSLVTFTAESGSGTDYTISYAPVPEPSAWMLAAVGLIALGMNGRVRRLRRRTVSTRVQARQKTTGTVASVIASSRSRVRSKVKLTQRWV